MTGKHTSAFAHAGVLPFAAQAIEQAEQQLYTLSHEMRLLADLASAGTPESHTSLSLETLTVTLASYAERLALIHQTVQQVERQIREKQ